MRVSVCVRNAYLSPLPTLFLGTGNLVKSKGKIFCYRGRGEIEKKEVDHKRVKFWTIGKVSGLFSREMGESEQEIKSFKLYSLLSL